MLSGYGYSPIGRRKMSKKKSPLLLCLLFLFMTGCATLPRETIDAQDQLTDAFDTVQGSLNIVFEDLLETKWQLYLEKYQKNVVWPKVEKAVKDGLAKKAQKSPETCHLSPSDNQLIGRVQQSVDDEIYNQLEKDIKKVHKSFQINVMKKVSRTVGDNMKANQKWNLLITNIATQALNLTPIGKLASVAKTADSYLKSNSFSNLVGSMVSP